MRHLWVSQSENKRNGKMQFNKEELFQKEFAEALHNQQQNLTLKKEKRIRSAFTTEQVNYLEREFKKSPYIGNAHRKEVAYVLNIPERAVKIWFQNRRMKEKKDVNKDHECDDTSNRKNVEFGNDRLSNAMTITSANERNYYSLPKLSTSPPDIINRAIINQDTINMKPSGSKTQDSLKLNYYSDVSPDREDATTSKVFYNSPLPIINHPPDYKSSAEYSIDLCKKYKNNYISADKDRKPVFENNNTQISAPSQGISSINELTKMELQNAPQDLSLNKSTKSREPSPVKVSPKSPGYIPVYVNYPQPYISAGNMLWKPVNVLPVMSTAVSPLNITNHHVHHGSISMTREETKPKKKCNCDCHVEETVTPMISPESSANPQAQYVITALPFQNFPKF